MKQGAESMSFELPGLTSTRYLVKLAFREPAHFHWFHGPALSALLCRALERHPLGREIIVFPVESGVIDYSAGEPYHLGVTLAGSDTTFVQRLAVGLRREGETPYEPAGFVGFDVIAVEELPLEPFRMPVPAELFDFRLITPLRMERKNPLKGRRFFDTSFFDGGRFLRLLYDRLFDLSKIGGGTLPPYVVPEIPETSVEDMELLWVDVPYHGGEKTCGGIIGTLRIRADLDERWLRLLHAAQFIHVGRNASLGFGNYSCVQLPVEHPIMPARSLIDRIVGSQNLQLAFEHVRRNADIEDLSGEYHGETGNDCNCPLGDLARTVKDGSYEPGLLRGVVIPKSSGNGVRALAIPPVTDRVLQRAACQTLAPGIDTLLEESSFAYRRGLSRKSAAHAIDRARHEGYCTVLASDVNAFFDTVSWEKMERKLTALYIEPAVVALLCAWFRSDVVFNGRRIGRTRGLAQGTAVSPLLANLYLDEFDEALGEDFKLVRYADDFVVLCRSEEEAKRALERAHEVLGRLSLEVKKEKTGIVDFERGFQYLGYLFCRSMIVERKKKVSGSVTLPDSSAEMIPPESWLTHVDFRKTGSLADPAAAVVQRIHGETSGSGKQERITVYLSDPDVLARLSGKTLVLSRLDDPAAAKKVVPLECITAVVDYGKPSMTMHALTELGKRGIPVYFCNHNGKMYLSVPGLFSNYELWSLQEQCRMDDTLTTGFARTVVCAKIHNYLTLCRRYEWTGDASKKLASLEKKCTVCTDIESIRGYEGKAAAVWFTVVKGHLDSRWSFTGRAQHPPPDPVNTMLSFGYSCLYHHISTALQMTGLNPCTGWFHESRPNYHALACDLQEEFRHIVDSMVLYLLHRNMVTPDCFDTGATGSFPCLMKKEFRKVFLGHLEEKLLTEFMPPEGERTISYRDCFLRQARLIADICRNPEIPYKPLRIR